MLTDLKAGAYKINAEHLGDEYYTGLAEDSEFVIYDALLTDLEYDSQFKAISEGKEKATGNLILSLLMTLSLLAITLRKNKNKLNEFF